MSEAQASESLPREDMRSHRAALEASAGGARDLDALAPVLSDWLDGRLGSQTNVTNLRGPEGAGIANETWLFDASFDDERGKRRTRALVLRVKPAAVQIFPDPDFSGLFRLLDTLHRQELVRVPEVLWLEEDPSVIGAPFLVMGMLEGRVPVSEPTYTQTGWVVDASPEQQRLVWQTGVEELSRIHAVPVDRIDFIGWPHYGKTGEDQQIGYWEHYRQWGALPLSGPIAELGEWVIAHRPHEPDLALSWGDARFGNMMFGHDYRLVAVMDWDEMSLAGPRHDLAWWLFFDDFHTERKGIPRPAGFGTRQDTIDLWEDRTGLRAGDLSWHEAFVGYKLGLITLRMFLLAGQSPEQAQATAGFMVGIGRAAAGLA